MPLISHRNTKYKTQNGQANLHLPRGAVLHLGHFNVNQYAFELHQSFLRLWDLAWPGFEHFFWLFLFRYDFMA